MAGVCQRQVESGRQQRDLAAGSARTNREPSSTADAAYFTTANTAPTEAGKHETVNTSSAFDSRSRNDTGRRRRPSPWAGADTTTPESNPPERIDLRSASAVDSKDAGQAGQSSRPLA